jgi:hypothetical protein
LALLKPKSVGPRRDRQAPLIPAPFPTPLFLASKGISGYSPPTLGRILLRVVFRRAFDILPNRNPKTGGDNRMASENDEKETDFNGYYEHYGRIRSTLG